MQPAEPCPRSFARPVAMTTATTAIALAAMRRRGGGASRSESRQGATLSEVIADQVSGVFSMPSGSELIRQVKEQIREVDPREVYDALASSNGNGRAPAGRRARAARVRGVAHPRRRPRAARLPRVAHRGQGRRQVAAGRPLLRERPALRARGPHSADAPGLRGRRLDDRRHHALEGPRLRGRDAARARRRPEEPLLAPRAAPRRSASRASSSCSTRRCCCSAPAGSARPPRSTWPPRAWARSASSTTTSSTSPTSSARSSTPTTGSASRRSTRPSRRSRRSTPTSKVVKYPTRLDASNIMEIIEGYDVIVDGVDNFPTRYLLNDATVRLKIPVVSASILGFDGQLSVFTPYEGRATAASTRRRRRPSWRRRAGPTACSACCPARWGCSRPPRSSS